MGGGITRELRLSAFRGRVASAEGRVGPESIKQNCNFAPTFVRRGAIFNEGDLEIERKYLEKFDFADSSWLDDRFCGRSRLFFTANLPHSLFLCYFCVFVFESAYE